MCFNAPICGLVVVVVGVLLSTGVLYAPSTPLSARITKWHDQGAFFSYNGHNIFYKDVEGAGSGGTLICLHGFPTFSWDWSKILPGLQSQFGRVVLLDFLGYGLSDKPSPHSYSIFEQADVVTHLADHLSARDVHLLSHDYGDTVALELLARHNQAADRGIQPVPVLALQSLTMLNGGIFQETHRPRILQKLMLIPVLGPVLSRLMFFRMFKIGFGEIFGDNKPTEEEYSDFYAAIVHQSGHHVTSSLLQYIPERQQNKDRWVGALRNSLVPVLMIYGPGDPVNPPQFAEVFRKQYEGVVCFQEGGLTAQAGGAGPHHRTLPSVGGPRLHLETHAAVCAGAAVVGRLHRLNESLLFCDAGLRFVLCFVSDERNQIFVVVVVVGGRFASDDFLFYPCFYAKLFFYTLIWK
ncbi:mesoderm-specific transcript homolog protein-like isoform X2 [Babylonia areolata]|uniref:mesoderm-specific transcript homolog protein-like isoform X2 n=1 Tax=Babylonia areolata TaxID=304850 RepID=UPI003FD2E763